MTPPRHPLRPSHCAHCTAHTLPVLPQGPDYVVGEYVDVSTVHGSRRQADKPYVSPEALAAPPPPGMLASLPPPPSKKRKSICEYSGG